ncbi:hypothetical protein [Kaarinaea lacus]
MLNRAGITLGLLVALLLSLTAAHADGLEEFVMSQLDGKGTVDSINVAGKQLVIDDRSYVISRSTTVFDVNNRKRVSLDGIKAGDTVGFKSKPLSKPTAPYDQSLIKIWILPSKG